jgi:hypothetical protein
MMYHLSSAVTVAVVATAATVLVAGYRARTHAVWRDLRGARRSVRTTRRDVLTQTIQFVTAAVLILATLFAAAYTAAR